MFKSKHAVETILNKMISSVNHRTVIVGVAVGAGLLVILVIGCSIWCCCCRGRKARARKMQQQEDEYQAQRDAIADKHEARWVKKRSSSKIAAEFL